MRNWILSGALVAAGSAFGASPALAAPDQNGGGPPATCKADIEKLCAGVKPGAGRILRCLDQHKNEASRPCRSALGGAAAAPGGQSEGAHGHANRSAAPDKGRKGPDREKNKVASYDILEFVMVTGSDDLRGDSWARAVIKRPDGKPRTCTLKAVSQDSWGNGSTHTATCELGSPMTLENLQRTRIVIAYNGTGAGTFESQDNWNLNGVTINAYDQDHRPICIFSASGNPLHRFQDVNGGVFITNDSIVVTDLPSRCR